MKSQYGIKGGHKITQDMPEYNGMDVVVFMKEYIPKRYVVYLFFELLRAMKRSKCHISTATYPHKDGTETAIKA